MKAIFKKANEIYPHGSLREQPEEWRDISGYEGMYQVSSKGRIKSRLRGVAKREKRFYFKRKSKQKIQRRKQ